MKTVTNYWKIMCVALAAVVAVSCDDSETPVEAPLAFFSHTVSEENTMEVTFTNETLNADSYSWDFGDGAGTSVEQSPTYEYTEAGTYSVVLTATNEGGNDTHTVEVTVMSAAAVNVITNGTFDDASGWTVISHNTSGNGSLVIADGVATINQEADATDWGMEGHYGAYQAVELEAGTYTVNFDIAYDGIENAWFEAWVGPNEPVEGADYNGDSGATTAVSPANSWNCATTYSGTAIDAACGDATGSITIETAGTYYIALRGGGWVLGADGFVFDNVTMFLQ